jgi:hypothetical protein
MANATGMIRESIWRDGDWRLLSRSAQALYMQLISQKELDCAGVLPLQPHKWAKGCADLTVEQVWADLEELQQCRFVFYDDDTDEAFVRSYVRNSNVLKIPNMRKAAGRAALLVGSHRIRAALALELKATKHPDFAPIITQLSPPNTPKNTNPSPNPSPNGSGTLTEPTGVGMGMGEGVTVGNQLREGAQTARPQCPRHETNTEDTHCRPCMKRRQWDEAHQAQQHATNEATQLDTRRRAKERADNCPDCHGTNLIDIDDTTATKCTHPNTTPAHA